jgi:hypothetical protein
MVERKKLYLVYDCKEKEIYGWTENEVIAKQFMEVRNHKRFVLKEKKFKIRDAADDFEYRKFCSDNSNKHLFANYLGGDGDGEKMLSFVTTSYENMKLEEFCDKTFDSINEFSQSIFMNAFEEEIINAILYMHECATKNQNEYISFDSFMVFMMLFGDTVL